MVMDTIMAKNQDEKVYGNKATQFLATTIAKRFVEKGYSEGEVKDACEQYLFDTTQYGGRIEPAHFFNYPRPQLYSYEWYLSRVAEGYREFDIYVPLGGGKALFRHKDGTDVKVTGYEKK